MLARPRRTRRVDLHPVLAHDLSRKIKSSTFDLVLRVIGAVYLKGQGLSKLVISRVTISRALITLLITYLLSPLPLQVLLALAT